MKLSVTHKDCAFPVVSVEKVGSEVMKVIEYCSAGDFLMVVEVGLGDCLHALDASLGKSLADQWAEIEETKCYDHSFEFLSPINSKQKYVVRFNSKSVVLNVLLIKKKL